MPLYRYVRGHSTATQKFQRRNFSLWPTWFSRIIPIFLILASVPTLGYLAYSYSIWTLELPFLSLPKERTQPLTLIASQNYSIVNSREPKINTSVASGQVLGQSSPQIIWERFYLTIPALRVENAVVTTNTDSFSKDDYLPILKNSLAHYKGTSLPGESGNVFIYGHSVLPAFFNPKDYSTIFSTLDKLKKGDEIILNWGERLLKYRVIGSQIVNPEDVGVIDYSLEGERTLSLMTCFPPGLKTKRLIVTARQIE